MKASIWLGKDKFEVRDVPIPEIMDDQVLVKVKKVGLCGTDVHITQGLFPSTPPKILGHEFSGKIVDVGKNVDKNNIGKRVACNTTSSCGNCHNCKNWTISRCSNEVKSSGAFAEFSVMPLSSAIEIPDNMSYEVAAMTEPASCCLSGTEMIGYKDDSKILIIGSGIMGILCLKFVKQKNIGYVVVSEPNPLRRKMALEMGADFVIDPRGENYQEDLEKLKGEYGFDVFVEAVGNPNLLAEGISHLGPRGQALMIGVHPEMSNLEYDLYDLHYKEIRLFGAFGRGDSFSSVPKIIESFGLEKLVTRTFNLDEINKAIDLTAEGNGMKYMISP